MRSKYLTVRNILFTVCGFIVVVFLYPTAGGFWHDVSMEQKTYPIFIIIEAIIFAGVWSFSSIIERRWRKVLIMSISSCLCMGVLVLAYNYRISIFPIPIFFNPIALCLPFILIYDKRYKKAMLGYLLGILLSSVGMLLPVIIPLLFLQLYLCEYPVKQQTKWESFFSRTIPYYIISIGFLLLRFSNQKGILGEKLTEIYWPIIIGSLYIAGGFILLYTLLNKYYVNSKSWKYYLAFAPGVCVLPLILTLWDKTSEPQKENQCTAT